MIRPEDIRFSVAPMMDWTDRHCRYFHRLLSRRARLYTEMLTTGAVIHGDRLRLMGYDAFEHPIAFQIGGSDPKQLAQAARVVEEFGYDACVDYKSPTFVDDLTAATPDGVDLYFDNTSGPISDAVHQRLNLRGRCVICGTASVASWDPTPLGPRVERLLLTRNLRMEGFSFGAYRDRRAEAIDGLSAMIASGELHYREEFLDGIEACPDSVAGLYRGENLGKRLIRARPLGA